MKTTETTVTATDNTIDLDTLARVSGGVAPGPSGGCTGPNCPKGGKGIFPSPMPMPMPIGPLGPFGDKIRRLGGQLGGDLGARLGKAAGNLLGGQ